MAKGPEIDVYYECPECNGTGVAPDPGFAGAQRAVGGNPTCKECNGARQVRRRESLHELLDQYREERGA